MSKCEPVLLPDSFRVGIRSAVRVSSLSVVLWTYQPLRDAPDGVEVRQAARLLSLLVAMRILALGGHIAHVADV
eukprot:7239536-Alexandrium_andersonii.AAC.1